MIAISTVATSAQIPDYSRDTNLLASKYIEPPTLGEGVRIIDFGRAMSYDDGGLIVADINSGFAWIYRQTGPTDYQLEAQLEAPPNISGPTLVKIKGDRVAIARRYGLYIYERQDSGEWTKIFEAELGRTAAFLRPMFFLHNEFYFEHDRFVENADGDWIRRGDNLLPVSDKVWIDGDRALYKDGRFRRRPPGVEINREWTWVEWMRLTEDGVGWIRVEGNDRPPLDELSGFDYRDGIMTWSTEETPPRLFIGDTTTASHSGSVDPQSIEVKKSSPLWGAKAVTAASKNLIAMGFTLNSSLELFGNTGNLAIFVRSEQLREGWRQLPIVYAENSVEKNAFFGASLLIAGNTVLAAAPGLNRVYILDLDDPTILNHKPEITGSTGTEESIPPGAPHEIAITLSDPDGDDIRWNLVGGGSDADHIETLEKTNQSLRLRYTPPASDRERQLRFTVQALDPSGASASTEINLKVGRPAPPNISTTRVKISIDEDAPETVLPLPELNAINPYDDPLIWELNSHSTLGQATLSLEGDIPTVRYRPAPNATGVEQISLVVKNQTTMPVPTTGVFADWGGDDDAALITGKNRIQIIRIGSNSPTILDTDRLLFRVYSAAGDLVYQRPLAHISPDRINTEAILNNLQGSLRSINETRATHNPFLNPDNPWIPETPLHETVIEDLIALAAPDGLITFETSLEIELTLTPHNDTPTLETPIELFGKAAPGSTLSLQPQNWQDLETPSDELITQFQWKISPEPDGTSAVDIPGARGPVLHLENNTAGKYVALEMTATDRVEPGHQGEILTGRAISQFITIDETPTTSDLSESISLGNLFQGRVVDTNHRSGFFLGGPWIGFGASAMNLNDPEAAIPIIRQLEEGFPNRMEINVTDQLGIVYLDEIRSIWGSENRFYEFPDILGEDRALFSQSDHLDDDPVFPAYARPDGSYAWFSRDGLSTAIRDQLGSGTYGGTIRVSRETRETWYFAGKTEPINSNQNQSLTLYSSPKTGFQQAPVEFPTHPGMAWGLSPDSQYLLIQNTKRIREPNNQRREANFLTMLETSSARTLWQLEIDPSRDRVLYRVDEHPVKQNPLAFEIAGATTFVLVRTTSNATYAALEFRSWETGEILKSLVAEEGQFSHGDWYSPENENLFIYPSTVDPSLVVLNLDSGESVTRFQPFRKQRDRLPTTEVSHVNVADDGILLSFWENDGIEDRKMIAYHPDAPGDVEGLVWDDTNQNGKLDLALINSDAPHIIYTLDVSGSTADTFQGTPVGDQNGDGSTNTILDAEIAAFIQFHENLLAFGLGDSAMVSVMVFGEDAATYTPAGIATDGPKMFAANGDDDGDQIPDVIASLRRIRLGSGNIGSGTAFNPPLTLARDVFASAGTQIGQGNIIFLSDGEAGRDFAETVSILRDLEVNLKAIGVGLDSSMSVLREIDPDAPQVSSTDDLIDIFEPTEPFLPGIEIFADLNGNGNLDPGEPATRTTDDNPFSPGNEAGYYHIPNLPAAPTHVRPNSTTWVPTIETELELIPVIRNRHLLAVTSTNSTTPPPNPNPEPEPDPEPEPPTNPTPPTPPVPVVPPAIAVHPGSLAVPFQQGASLFVLASGAEPLTYQWQQDGVNLPGANQSVLILASVNETHQGTYTVVIQNPGGSVTSNPATLTVVGLPEPVELEIDTSSIEVLSFGNKQFFAFNATGDPGQAYQAYIRPDLLSSTWTPIGDPETPNGTELTFFLEMPTGGTGFFKVEPTP